MGKRVKEKCKILRAVFNSTPVSNIEFPDFIVTVTSKDGKALTYYEMIAVLERAKYELLKELD